MFLQDALRTCFESTVLPSFERTCQTMFDQVESSFQHGMSEYTQHAQEQLLSSHSDLASTLKVCLVLDAGSAIGVYVWAICMEIKCFQSHAAQ